MDTEKLTNLPKPVNPTGKPPGGGASGDEGSESGSGPSWGLIIPIIMIGVFLACVALCLWWHKWQERRRLRTSKHLATSALAFQRSYRGGGRSVRGSYDTRDSTRSTTPLRSSLNEKNSINNYPTKKTINVNVVPIHRPNSGKYSFYWDKTHWKAMPTPLARSGTKPLSPIDEIESPASAKLSELSRNYDLVGAQSYSPYHLTWLSSNNAPPSYEESEHASSIKTRDLRHGHYSPSVRRLGEPPVANSPFFPNNNTPTTECDTESEGSQFRRQGSSHQTSMYTSYPSSPTSNTVMSRSNPLPSRNTSTDDHGNSLASSYHESSYQTSSYQTSSKQSQSATQPSSFYTTRSSNTYTTGPPSTNLSSLTSSIAPFSKQNVFFHNDPNNNSALVPNANTGGPSFPPSKLNYTLASSVSSDTHISDNTSMLPNIGSNNTSGYPTSLRLHIGSGQPSMEPSGPTSPEDLSKLVDEMSSIRHVDESSSMRPNLSVDPTPRITTISGTSLSGGLHRSWSVNGDTETPSINTTDSQQTSKTDGSMYWDNYPLTAEARSRSYQELPMHAYENHSFLGHVVELNYHVPILMDEQYWV